MIHALNSIKQSRLPDGLKRVSGGECVRLALEAMSRPKDSRRVSSGIPSLDRATRGFGPGQLIILAGRPSMGKTAVGLEMARHAARSGHGVYFASLEMEGPSVGQRLAAAECYDPGSRWPVHYTDIDEGGENFPRERSSDVYDAYQRVAGYPLEVEQEGAITLSEIAARARQVKTLFEARGTRLAVLFIDHLGIITVGNRYKGNRVHEISELTMTMKALAKELDVAIVCLCQLNRETEKRAEQRPQLSDLRDSGSIEQDADVVLGVYREAYYLGRKPDKTDEDLARLDKVENVLELEILKNRQGPTRRITLFCDIACNVISEAQS